MGMIGGGPGAFIGAVHRMAATLDQQIELVCGAFSSDPVKVREAGQTLYLAPERCYASYQEMFRLERARAEGDRIDFVSIVTPNYLHFPMAMAALEAGFPIMCDKPMTLSFAEAKQLVAQVEKSGLLFGLTHNYTGYPLVKEAREIIRHGDLGSLRKVVVEYPQGWLASRLEESGQKQADWRTDPARAGISCCIGDIGTHAENLAEYITGLQIQELAADLTTFVPGRTLDDDGNVLLRFVGGAKGILHASQISIDDENGLNIRVYGEKGGLAWRQEEPNTLILKKAGRPRELVRAGQGYLGKVAQAHTRLPAGHPEGFIEAFANVYRNFAHVLRGRITNTPVDPIYHDFPTAQDGLRGMAFIEACVTSSKNNAAWTKLAI